MPFRDQRYNLPRMPGQQAERIYSVSEITQLIKTTLEDGFPWITIKGEISNFRPSSTGHWYFSLKDVDAVISVVMFRGRLDGVHFSPADGVLVKATGSVSVYAKRGSYQLICESLVKAGEGDILAMLEELKRKLAAEGLFDLDRKKKLPLFPSRIAVVTSPTGAAVRDILRILRRRNAGVSVVILPTPVQGDGADERIARAIELANRHALGEVIIVGRGGGSLEDLLPFSSERVVRAIAASDLPVISAVGHETDVTLSDLAADIRAPTPSAAAEMVAAPRAELLAQVGGLRSMLERDMRQRLERVRLLLGQFVSENLERNVRIFLSPLLNGWTTRRKSSSRVFAIWLLAAATGSSLPPVSSPPIRPSPFSRGDMPSLPMNAPAQSCFHRRPFGRATLCRSSFHRAGCARPWRTLMPSKSEESRKLARDEESRKKPSGFEERLERLEELAEKLREGKIPLDEAVLLFEEGMKLSRSLEKDLSRVERRVEILTREPESAQEEPGLELFPELSEEDTE